MANKKGLLILLSVLILLIIPFLILSMYIHPSADDYRSSCLVKAFGRWDYQVYMYTNWQGRYFANLIFSLNPLTFNSFIGYKIFALVLLTAFVISAFYFVFALLKNHTNALLKVIFALLLLLLYLNIIPSPSETIYWLTGSLEYFLPVILTLIFLSVIINGIRKENNKLISIIIACFLGLCICGSNEISMLFILEITALIVLLNLKNKKVIRFILPVFIVIILSSLLDVLAPGNYLRMRNFHNANNILYGFEEGIISVIKLAGIHIKSASFLIISILTLPVLSLINSKTEKPLININPWFALVLFVLMLISLFFPVCYSTGLPPPLRIYNTTSVFFIISWLYLIYLFIHHYELNLQIPKFIQTFLVIACIISFITDFYKNPGKETYFTGNISRAFYDVAFNAREYNDELNKRYEIIRNNKASGKLSVTVPELSVKPITIDFLDILKDTTSWINIGTAQYFDISSIRIK